MKKLRIGYDPISADLSHPADRRRVVFWAKNRGHEVITDLSLPHDVLVISERADIGHWGRAKGTAPRIFDLIDGYLEPSSVINDLVRGAAKVAVGQITGPVRRFSRFAEILCSVSDGVICSTPEQRETILKFNSNVHPILDSHDEFPLVPPRHDVQISEGINLFWEGLPFTLSNLSIIEEALNHLDGTLQVNASIVTDEAYPNFLGKFVTSSTLIYLQKNFPNLYSRTELISWSQRNVKKIASSSNLGIIPVSIDTRMNDYKAENRLLIMWRLGLPVLVSPTKAYSRVINSIDAIGLCNTPLDWEKRLVSFTTEQGIFLNQVELGQQYLAQYHSKDFLLDSWDAAVGSVI